MDKGLILGADIGGSHVSTALVDMADGSVQKGSFCKEAVNAQEISEVIFDQWVKAFEFTLSKTSFSCVKGIGISMPGPFDYNNGISLIKGVNKYEHLYGLNIKERLKQKLGFKEDLPIFFENDAVCFGLGESRMGEASFCKKVVAITLGTGLGATFLNNGEIQKTGFGVPPEGYLYHVPFRDGIAEDYLSTKWLVTIFNQLSRKTVCEAKEIYELALHQNNSIALEVFQTFGRNLGMFLAPWLKQFNAECLIIGGSLSKASCLFFPELKRVFKKEKLFVLTQISIDTESAAISGVAALAKRSACGEKVSDPLSDWRKTSQPLLPISIQDKTTLKGGYDMYPFHSLGAGKIFRGYDSLSQWISTRKLVLIDGYAGVDWVSFKDKCSLYFRQQNIRVKWWHTAAFQRPAEEVEAIVTPFLGTSGSVWGKKTTLALEDFYHREKLESLQPDPLYDVNIVIGVGASLSSWDAPVIYVDLPKNELQYRMRAKSITNLGCINCFAPAEMYKRFYFVDWVVLNAHRNHIKEKIAVVADGQWKDDLCWAQHSSVKEGLQHISQNNIRVRPWFEAGAWGGQWMKNTIPGLNPHEVNYAWSFELIVPENGIVFESNENLLEVSFDWLMEYDHRAVLGKDATRFGTEFPIRFDFLDTFDGGNLSIQCHPSLDYIQKEFGEQITQDETYYILDQKDDSQVYLGFQESIDAGQFRRALEKSQTDKVEVDIEKYVQKFSAHKHDLFLIPNGTIHSSGKNNLVLEISATPYIFTFKMYDWLRLDLNGEPRPINIEHAFNNLNFMRKGKKVEEELISRPQILEQTDNFQLVHLPTHQDHFYDVHRIEFLGNVEVETHDQCHVLMLVEGDSVVVKTKNGDEKIFHYAETFIIPAAAGAYTLINPGDKMLKVIKAFIK
jgi:predicted NBD/HSP70 family sugar kinase/mannose-6-phosphate isomerase class I